MDKITIGKIFSEGKVIVSSPLKIYYRENTSSKEERPAVSVPKKLFKRAVKRNLIRRRIKESFRLNNSLLEGKPKYDFLFVYISSEVFEYERIDQSIKELLSKLP